MGGSVGGAFKDAGRAGLGAMTFGTSELANQLLSKNGHGPLGQSFGSWMQNPGITNNQDNPYISGPFGLDPNQLAADQSAISGMGTKQSGDISSLGQSQYGAANQLGQSQFGDTSQFIASDAASRSAARDQLANLLTQNAQNVFSRTLPNIAENAQARHLYDSSGYGQEVARQQGYLGQDIANQMGQIGVKDIYNQSAQKAAALEQLQRTQQGAQGGLFGAQQGALQTGQGFQTGGLQRGLSLEDFINQANVAKTIGAQMAPPPPTGKSQFGTVASGVGALAPWGNLAMNAASGKGGGAGGGGTGGGSISSPMLSLFNSGSGYSRYS